MKPIITDLVERFESGRLSRRDLIGGLTMLVAASQVPAAQAPQSPGLVGNGIDHVSATRGSPAA